jgi:arsenate reductase-like glutaredoxin family protein
LLQQFIDALGMEAVLNQRSTSWRQLSDEQKHDLTPDKARQLLLDNPILIKRPILAIGEQWLVGFNPAQYAQTL